MRETYRHRLGTTATGAYVVVDVELEDEQNPGPWGLVDHSGDVLAPITLHVMGAVYEKGDRRGDPSQAGQVTDALGEITTPAPGWTLEEIAELRTIWDRWHLNTMRAGCAHQTELVYEDTAYGRQIDLKATTAANDCPAGYSYGSAWLAEELPSDVVDRVRHLMRDRSDDLYRARGYDASGKSVDREA